jgi:phage repressor protein C with HTH and peptisase S24 domain
VSIENQDSEKPRIAVARDLRFPNARQYALEVEGDSMDELFKDGSTVICVNFADTGLEYRDGMCVHVERFIMDGQLVENTLKELRREGKTKWVLYPRSSNPSHKPIELSGGETVDILVKGIVIGKWEPIFFA